ncbi:hypothetical protein LENED_001888 [Lentinula edodes]|uniref:Uncharacterized protein n=1 Tax=Lentinula edodes TaxID=5353 RepID=A0A1Q3DZP3_LENED|nr:hypothetical protein LENED_001888 [Lentinula edodes]
MTFFCIELIPRRGFSSLAIRKIGPTRIGYDEVAFSNEAVYYILYNNWLVQALLHQTLFAFSPAQCSSISPLSAYPWGFRLLSTTT